MQHSGTKRLSTADPGLIQLLLGLVIFGLTTIVPFIADTKPDAADDAIVPSPKKRSRTRASSADDEETKKSTTVSVDVRT